MKATTMASARLSTCLLLVLTCACSTTPPRLQEAPEPEQQATPAVTPRLRLHSGVNRASSAARAEPLLLGSKSDYRAPESLSTRLGSVRLNGLHFEQNASLREIMSFISSVSGVDIIVMPEAVEAVELESVQFDLDFDRPISVARALDLITELAGEDVAWAPRNGVVMITTREKARPDPRTYIYDVSDLIAGIRDHPAPEINVFASGYSRELEEIDEEPVSVVSDDALVELVRSALARRLGEDADFEVRIWDGKLVVRY